MKILFLSGRELSYSRNALLMKLLRDRYTLDAIGQPSGRASITVQSILGAVRGIPAVVAKEYQLILVGFFGHFLMLPIGLFSRSPILFDAFISTYDTLCGDRKTFTSQSLAGRLAHWLDRTSCSLASRVLLDTQSQVRYFSEEFQIPEEKFDVLFVGCDDEVFFPREDEPAQNTVLFYGTFLPLHGVSVILDAARLVHEVNPTVRFRIIGADAKALKDYRSYIEMMDGTLEMTAPIPFQRLPEAIASASICLGGHFGSSVKARRVISGKTYQCLAMGRPVIVSDNSANRELLTHGIDSWMCPENDPQSLANSILHLIDDPDLRENLAACGRRTYINRASNLVLRTRLKVIVEKTISSPS